jgi:hypothetical protein
VVASLLARNDGRKSQPIKAGVSTSVRRHHPEVFAERSLASAVHGKHQAREFFVDSRRGESAAAVRWGAATRDEPGGSVISTVQIAHEETRATGLNDLGDEAGLTMAGHRRAHREPPGDLAGGSERKVGLSQQDAATTSRCGG